MTNPLLSVITVTRNNLNGLKTTHQSLKTLTNYEWIVIDGNSQDNTVEYLKKTNAQYISEPDNGIYDAMNKGIEKAIGDYVIFMNAGDTFNNTNFLQNLSGAQYDFIYGDALETCKGQNIYKTARHHKDITQGMFTHHQAMIYNRTTLANTRYDTSYEIAADYDLTWKHLRHSKNILKLTKAICIFEEGGISQQRIYQGRKEQFLIRQKHGIGIIKNSFIFTAQSLLYGLRKIAPRLYWFLKR